MKPMMTARTCRFAASARPRIDYRRRLSLAGLAVECVLLAGCSLLGGGGPRERGTIYAPDPPIDADRAWPPVGRKRVVEGKGVAVRESHGGLRLIKKKTTVRGNKVH